MVATNGHEAVVKLLLDSDKADADAKDTRYGRTPLWCTTAKGHEAIVKLLLDSDADVKDNRGWMPLRRAAMMEHKVVVGLLRGKQ